MSMVAEAFMRIPLPKQLLPLLISVALAGCSGGGELQSAVEDYHARLARVLEASLPEPGTRPALPYPAPASLRLSVPAVSVNLREFYALQECELGTLVAERNTAVGKTQQPSQRLAYETRLLAIIDECIAALGKTSHPLATRLQEIKAIKREQRDYVWANLIQSSQEMHYALGMPQQMLAAEGNRDARAGITSLHYLTSRAANERFTLSELEQQLQQAASARLPAKLFQTQRYLADTLPPLTHALAPQLNDVGCDGGRPSEQAKILRNVFYLFFIEQIQPVGSRLNDYHYQLVPVWTSWLAHPALSGEFKVYIKQYAMEGFDQYQAAVKQHVTLWQNFLARCNLSPRAPG